MRRGRIGSGRCAGLAVRQSRSPPPAAARCAPRSRSISAAVFADEGIEPLYQARRQRRRGAEPRRIGDHHLAIAHRHLKIVRREPCCRSGGCKPDADPHAAAHPRARISRRRPDVLVHPGQDHQVRIHQPRFELAPDEDVVAPPLARLHLLARHQRGQHRIEIVRRERRTAILEPSKRRGPPAKFEQALHLGIADQRINRAAKRRRQSRRVDLRCLQ